MASDRSRITARAEKLVAQGKIEAAVAQYELLARQNPRDLNTINKIGDLYARLGKKKQALEQFKKLSARFEKDGFIPKAIAIYKKMVRIDPDDLGSCRQIASLQVQQGRVREARSQYVALAAKYKERGDVDNVIGVYRDLISLDPKDVRPREALADLLIEQKRTEEAGNELAQLGAELDRQGKHEEARSVYKRAAELNPGSADMTARFVASHVASGDIESGIKLVKESLGSRGDDTDLLALLGDIHVQAGQPEEAEEAFRRAIDLAPSRMDLRVRLARLCLARGDADKAFESLEPCLKAGIQEGDRKDAVALLEKILNAHSGHRETWKALIGLYQAMADEENTVRCTGKVLDLCISASDYEQAEFFAQKLVALRPNDPSVQEKLDLVKKAVEGSVDATPALVKSEEEEPVADEDQPASAETAAPAEQEGPAGLDPKAVKALGLPDAIHLEPDDEDFITEHMTEADVFVKYGLAERAIEQLSVVTGKYPGYPPAHAKLKEIYLEDGQRDAARAQMVLLVKGYLAADDRAAAEEALSELRMFDPACREVVELDAVMSPDFDASTVIPVAPDEPDRASKREPAKPSGETKSVPKEEEEEEEFEITSDEEAQAVEAAAGASSEPPAGKADEAEFDFTSEEEPQAVEATAEASSKPPAGKADEAGSLLDLASELEKELNAAADLAGDALPGQEAEPEGGSLEEIVDAFKKRVEEEVESDDSETHYNLGIAYKEMGLIDEAIGEFQVAAKDKQVFLNCCSMLGMCFRQKDMPSQALKWYRRGVQDCQDGDEEAMLGVRYDLAELLSEMGEKAEALELFTEIFGTNSKFRDVAARIEELKN